MTVLPELLPIALDMMLKLETGTINLTNPGLISHNEILEMYKEIVDKDTNSRLAKCVLQLFDQLGNNISDFNFS